MAVDKLLEQARDALTRANQEWADHIATRDRLVGASLPPQPLTESQNPYTRRS